MVVASIRQGAAKSGRAMLRSKLNFDPTLANRWEVNELIAYSYACCRRFASSSHISICPDAARLGDPPEEALTTLVLSMQGDIAAVAPPQVSCEGV